MQRYLLFIDDLSTWVGKAFAWCIIILTLAWLNNISAPPPPNVSVIGVSSLIYFSLMIAAMYWINRLRRS